MLPPAPLLVVRARSIVLSFSNSLGILMARLILALLMLLGLVVSAPAVDLATIDGRRFQEAEITWFYNDAVIVRYEGVKYARLALNQLRPESLVALGFPPPAEEPAEGMLDGMDGMNETAPVAPPQPTPRLRPLGSMRQAPQATIQANEADEIEAPQAMEETEAARQRMRPRQGMSRPQQRQNQQQRPNQQRQRQEQRPKPPEQPFEEMLEQMLREGEEQRLQDRNLDGDGDKIDARPFPGDNL